MGSYRQYSREPRITGVTMSKYILSEEEIFSIFHAGRCFSQKCKPEDDPGFIESDVFDALLKKLEDKKQE